MNLTRRNFWKTLAATSLVPAAAAQQAEQRAKGLPPLLIKDAKVITTSAGARYRWVFLKLFTSEPGLYGIGTANNAYQTQAVIAH